MCEKLLILDLDETLIFGVEEPLERAPDFICGSYSIYLRPGVDGFLAYAQENFQTAVWTTANESYAQCVVETIFPAPKKLRFLWSRRRCVRHLDRERQETVLLKDLKKLRTRGHSLDKVIVIDDTPHHWQRNYGNLVRVEPYLGSPEDDELTRLSAYLDKLKLVDDVRAIEKRAWRTAT